MKALKIAMVMLIAVACIMPVLVVKEAQAAPGWATCYVNEAGQGNQYKFVKLTSVNPANPPATATWYYISTTYGGDKEMLSTALSAMVSGMKVYVYVTDLAQYGQVTTMYLLDK